MTRMVTRRTVVSGIAAGSATIAGGLWSSSHAGAQEESAMTEATPSASAPTVVLVHGAFADGSGWNWVMEGLRAQGASAVAITNPLRGVDIDAAYAANYFAQVPGPVLAVGHSYGGAVITNAAANAENVVGLVYVAAFAPDEGETLLEIEGDSRDSVLASALLQRTYPVGDGSGTETELIVDPKRFKDAFAADVEEPLLSNMAFSQRPVSQLAFSQPTKAAAWKRLPSWAIVPTADYAAGSDVVRAMAHRAGADIVEAEGSHVIMVSQPRIVTDQILKALAAVG